MSLRSEILVREGTAARPVAVAAPGSVRASSAGRGWRGLAAERQLLPATEFRGHMLGDLVSVPLGPPRARHEWRGGRESRVVLGPGDVYVLPAGEETHAAWREPGEAVNVLLDPTPGGLALEGGVLADRVLAGLGQALAGVLDEPPSPAEGLVVDGLREALRARLAGRAGTDADARRPARLSRRELDRVEERIAAGLDGPLHVEDLAAAVPMSPAHFARSFRATTGRTPHVHVLRRRLDVARALLAGSDVPVAEVARRAGFADAGHLARHLRRAVGLPPAAYRKAVRGG